MQYLTLLLKESTGSSDKLVQKKIEEGWEFDDYIPVGKNTVVIFRKK